MLKSDLLTVPSSSIRIDEGDDAEYFAARLGHRDQAALIPHGRPGINCPPQGLLPARGALLRVGLRPAGTSPGGEVAVTILDGHRQPRQLGQRPGDAVLALPGGGYRGEPVVDVQATLRCR
jgi:hypothetical protein